MIKPTYITGYNIALLTDDWDAITRIVQKDLAQYIADEIAGEDGLHTIYGLSEEEVQEIGDSVAALQTRLLRAIKIACQGWPKAIHEALDAADENCIR